MKEIKVQKGQSIIDICIEHYGAPQAMFELHELNGFVEIPKIVQAGDIVKVDPDNSTFTNQKELRAMKGASVATYFPSHHVKVNGVKLLVNGKYLKFK